ncbi:MAG: ferritin-like domain-containing protein [Bacteroidota bacterium]|nr:ferritin-like domain-containing protein [Bacteroidota bacterium]
MDIQTENTMHDSKLMELFINELKEIYCAELALVESMPMMFSKASSKELKETVEIHFAETKIQVQSLEKVFVLIGMEPKTKKCEAMVGLLNEAESIMRETEKGAMRDAGIISAAQKVEHYEIACYGILRSFANTMGLTEAASIFHEILEQEKETDEKLTLIAESTINSLAASEKKVA